MTLLFLLVPIIFAIVCANIAEGKGRGKGIWFFLGLIAGPFSLIVLLLLHKDEVGLGNIKCPYCAEFVKPEAVVCKHCGKDLAFMRDGFGDTIPCLSCGHGNHVSAGKCENCGHSFAS